MGNQQKNFNVNIDSHLSDDFSSQVEERGYIKYRAIEGALRGFMALSTEEQVKLIAGNNAEKAKKLPPPTAPEYVDIDKAIEDLTYYVKFKLPSPEEQKKLSELRKELGPEPKKQKKKAKRG